MFCAQLCFFFATHSGPPVGQHLQSSVLCPSKVSSSSPDLERFDGEMLWVKMLMAKA